MQIMMKKISLWALLVVLSLNASAQSNSSEIYLLDITQKDGKYLASSPYRITQNDYYDNQPCFSADGQFLYFVARPDTIQSDIYEFHIKKKIMRQVTNTPESEYQPQLIPFAKDKISAVVVEKEGAQKLYEMKLDGSSYELLMPNEDSLAYYCWMNDTTVGAYMLNGGGGTLHQFDMIPQQSIILMEGGFGRCLAVIPGTNILTYVQKGSDGKNTLMRYDMSNEERMPMLEFPAGVEDYCWGPKETIYCSDKGILYVYDTKIEDTKWIPIGDFSETIGTFYRMAMNKTGDKIAIVTYKGEKP
jgi:WD40-like Beta Propeller Repeat